MTRLPGFLVALLLATAAFAESADLRIQAHAFNLFDALFVVTNNGPDFARDVVVTIDLPEALTITRASFDAVPCDTTVRPVRCMLGGDVYTGQVFPRYGGLDVTGPLADATYDVTFTVSSPTPDPDASNNTASLTWVTKIEADLDVLVFAQTDRVDPGGSGSYVANICNGVRDNMPANVHADLSLTNGTITTLTPATGFTCTVDGASAVCTTQALGNGCPAEPFRIAVRADDDRDGGQARLTIKATPHIAERNPANNEHSDDVPIYRWITVDTIADSGPGSLRDAIRDANANCTPGPCRIVFEIPGPVPAEGWFTITPAEPLPPITAERVTLEGSRQTTFTGDTNPHGPEIAIDGRLAHRGLQVLTKCEGLVEGLAIGNFDEDQGLWLATGAFCDGRPDRRAVTGNHIGVDPSGTAPWPNRRGLRADDAHGVSITRNVISHNFHSGLWMWRGAGDIKNNRIERNGASGILVGPEVTFAAIERNVINGHPQMGIAAARGAQQVTMQKNSMRDNGGLGIDWALDGVSPSDGDDHDRPPNAPLMLSARFNGGNSTTVVVSINSALIGRYYNDGVLDFYVSDSPDADGERWIWETAALPNQTLTITLFGDHRGKWINATWTRRHTYYSRPGDPRTDSHEGNFVRSTSELSNAVRVE